MVRDSSSTKRVLASTGSQVGTNIPGQHTGSSSFGKQQATLLPHSGSNLSIAPQDEHLFHTPLDLVCPITLSLFQDPVCNSLGQVYERAAIQRHLLQAAVSGQPPTDPISNAVLPSLDLVPIWPMRSRAAEYRDSTIRACVLAAAAPDCSSPVKYLRRAAELVLAGEPPASISHRSSSSISSSCSQQPTTAAGAGAQQSSSSPSFTSTSPAAGAAAAAGRFSSLAQAPAGSVAPSGPSATAAAGAAAGAASMGVPGMTLEFAQYLSSHQGSQYDALVLKYFGNELLRGGCPDAASNVFYRLLLEAEDRVQQAEYLQLCLDCWTSSSSSAESGNGTGDPMQEDPAATVAAGDITDRISDAAAAQQQGKEQETQQHPPSAPKGTAAAHNPMIISKLADFVQRQRCLSPSAIVQMLQGTHHGAAMALELCQVLLARAAAAAAAADPAQNAEAVLGLPGGLGGVLEVLLQLVELGHGQLVEQLQQLADQVQQLQAVQQQQQQQQAASAAAGETGAVDAGSSDPRSAAHGSGPAAAQSTAGSSSDVHADAGQRSRASGRRRHGRSWKGGKGADVVLGRILRIAAAGTLAAANLLSAGNHPMLRLARVGPLLYLLRSGL